MIYIIYVFVDLVYCFVQIYLYSYREYFVGIDIKLLIVYSFDLVKLYFFILELQGFYINEKRFDVFFVEKVIF